MIIKHDDVKIDFSTVFITQNKIPSSGFLQLDVSVSSLLEQMTQPWNIPLLNDDVQVLVRAGLLTKEGVNTPPAVNPKL